MVGPTASGKSSFGVWLAKKIGGEIISADSRQVYKWLDVGSGKITKKEMIGVPHHCLDIASPKKVFTAYDFQQCAQKAIREIWEKNKIPIIVGGTGFYIDAFVGKVVLSNTPPSPKLRKLLKKKSIPELFLMLKKLDPKRAKNIDRNNKVRLVRAIEVSLIPTPRPKSVDSTFVVGRNILWVGIKRTKADLKKRIHKRLVERITEIIKEIKKLHLNGVSWKRLFDFGLEYRYISLYLRKKDAARRSRASLASLRRDMIKKLETEINKYAKRQITYWKKNKEIKWLSVEKAKKLIK